VRLTSVRCFLTSVKFLTKRRAAMCGIVSLHRRIFRRKFQFKLPFLAPT